jgi:uncharacterized protein (TIGR01777 family)
MMIVMAGASGFLGTALRARLAADGHRIVQLVRRPPTGPDQHRWRPEAHELDETILAGAGAVVNLCGAGVEDHRWSDGFKKVILASRVDPTVTLARSIAVLPADRRPAVLVNASGVHFYGEHGDTELDESSPSTGDMFLTEVCRQWEAALEPARAAGVRAVALRTGLVLDRRGGLLRTLTRIFRLFAGGRLGNGRQWMPWISLNDWNDAVVHLIATDLDGPVNLVGPAPVRNAEFTRALARALHRPAVIPVPSFGLALAVGQFGPESIASIRVLPKALLDSGYIFTESTVDDALRVGLGA